MITKAKDSAACLLRSSPLRPAVAVILGSGFDGVRHAVKAAVEIPYSRLPGFLPAKVEGHSGRVLIGTIGEVPILTLCGRSHYYEGHSLAEVAFPVRVLAECGVRAVLLTNAAGGINPKYQPGDLMCLTDHMNFMSVNPLRGWSGAEQTPFVDLTQTYDPHLNRLLGKAARQSLVRLHYGVYVAVSGPSYETPAEIRAFARLGGDAVGMSTVPEAVVAKQCGLRVAAVSCITNAAAGLNAKPISHAEVLAAGERVQAQVSAFVQAFIRLLARVPDQAKQPEAALPGATDQE